MAQGLQKRSCFKYLNIIKKTTPSPTPTFKKLKNFKPFLTIISDIFRKKTPIPYPTIGKVW